MAWRLLSLITSFVTRRVFNKWNAGVRNPLPHRSNVQSSNNRMIQARHYYGLRAPTNPTSPITHTRSWDVREDSKWAILAGVIESGMQK